MGVVRNPNLGPPATGSVGSQSVLQAEHCRGRCSGISRCFHRQRISDRDVLPGLCLRRESKREARGEDTSNDRPFLSLTPDEQHEVAQRKLRERSAHHKAKLAIRLNRRALRLLRHTRRLSAELSIDPSGVSPRFATHKRLKLVRR